MGSSDEYAGIARRYDLFARPNADAARFFERLFDLNGVARVLDCACGTGQDLMLFHELGRIVVGSDRSAAMLGVAQKRLAERGLTIELHELDYRDLPSRFAPTFDAVACLSTSIAHMPDEEQVLRALRSMRAVLREDGILVLSQGTTDRQWRERPRFVLALDTPEVTRLFVIDYHDRGATYSVVDIVREPAAGLEVWSTDYPLMLLHDDQERLLREAGFDEVEFYGSYGAEPYDKAVSTRLIAVARK